MKTNTTKINFKLIVVISFLAIVLIGSLLAMWMIRSRSQGSLVAYVYQDGELIHEIPLSLVTEPYTIEVWSDTSNANTTPAPTNDQSNGGDIYTQAGGYNQIEVRHGSIGMIDANCPDKLCVHMGFQDNAMVPITCLPNKVVIQLRIEGNNDNKLDGVSH